MPADALVSVDPQRVYFTFSRIRPFFSCGRRIEDTLQDILQGKITPGQLPPIQVLYDSVTGDFFSLNNRRLFVFKTLCELGRLKDIPVRIKPVPQTRRMKDKYSREKCSLSARLMLERDAESISIEPEEKSVDAESDTNESDLPPTGAAARPKNPIKNHAPPKEVDIPLDSSSDEGNSRRRKNRRGQRNR